MVRIAVIGAGFSGIGITSQVLAAGYDDVTVFEKGQDVGGVWRENDYPGAACDVASHLYSFSFAPEGRWSKRYAEQPEIHAYLRRTADELGVTPKVRFGTEIARCSWDDDRRVWSLDQHGEFDVVIAACGQLSRPHVPDLPGAFAGPLFHSAQWRHDVDLTGKRVLVVGTGASAVQFVPRVAQVASHVTVLQRSAPWVLEKDDRTYSPRVQELLRDHPNVLQADRLRTFVSNELRSLGFNTEPRLMKAFERQARKHIEEALPARKRELAVPDYPIGCKRILISNEWYSALAKDHVDVVNAGVKELVPTGALLENGDTVEADVVILGTGFTATELLAPMQVEARGRTLQDAWSGGAEAYLGSAVAGFPNLFLLYGPNTNLGHNSIILMLESQFRWILQAVGRVRPGGSVEVRPQVMRRYNDWLQKRLKGTVFATGCDSWYLTDTGRNTQNWPGTTVAFRWRTRRLRDTDLEVRT
ncbi:MAG: NAD(P)/FAD-dependent oxidoreductase [Frankiales bacterium]|nr:NAD(P)/FAD-dependent oxidoreductase [Frankiales bacterium]